MAYIQDYRSPFGTMLMVSDGQALTGLWFDKQKYFSVEAGFRAEKKDLPVFRQTKAWLDEYFSGSNPSFLPPIRLHGSPFRQQVWEILQRIPYGKLVSYGDIAKELAAKKGVPVISAQAVGGAVGHNPVSILVPCHRVVGKNGCLTGYGGGLDKKIFLLQTEGVDMSSLYLPKKGTAL